jgi:L-aminopeptidase/D-esterase-like protein
MPGTAPAKARFASRALAQWGQAMSAELLPPPDGFRIGHWTDSEARTGCTVVIPPPDTRGAAEVRGGGTGTREIEVLAALANAEGPTAVLLTGGSAFGLAAADGVMRWLEERGLGRATPLGPVPLVSAAVVFDLAEGDAGVRPGPDQGYAACEAAGESVPERGPVGAGAGAAVGKVMGRERATRAGVGYAAGRLGDGTVVAAVAVANAAGDVIGAGGEVLGGPRGEEGERLRSAELIPAIGEPPYWAMRSDEGEGNTTLVCVMTDATLDKRGCGIVARMASAGVARAVDPVFSPVDGDVVFCLASGEGAPPPPSPAASWTLTALGSVAATVTAEAIRDSVAA